MCAYFRSHSLAAGGAGCGSPCTITIAPLGSMRTLEIGKSASFAALSARLTSLCLKRTARGRFVRFWSDAILYPGFARLVGFMEP